MLCKPMMTAPWCFVKNPLLIAGRHSVQKWIILLTRQKKKTRCHLLISLFDPQSTQPSFVPFPNLMELLWNGLHNAIECFFRVLHIFFLICLNSHLECLVVYDLWTSCAWCVLEGLIKFVEPTFVRSVTTSIRNARHMFLFTMH